MLDMIGVNVPWKSNDNQTEPFYLDHIDTLEDYQHWATTIFFPSICESGCSSCTPDCCVVQVPTERKTNR